MPLRPVDIVPTRKPELPQVVAATSPDAIVRLLGDSVVPTLLRPGLYVGEDRPTSFASARRERVLARVAASEAVIVAPHWYSHDTAATLHGLWTNRLADGVHLTQLSRPQIRREPLSRAHRFYVTRHWTPLAVEVRTVIYGVPVTSLERTAIDCARTQPFGTALMTMDSALRAGANVTVLRRLMDQARGRRGVRQARVVLRLSDKGAESPGESLTRALLIERGFPPPTTQIRVHTNAGDRWIDLGWPEVLVGVEFDGDIKYETEPDEVRQAERRRQAAIEAEGWSIVRLTWPDLAESGPFIARLHGALADRRLLLGPGIGEFVTSSPLRKSRGR